MIGNGLLRGRSLPAAAVCAVGAALLSHPLVPAASLLPQRFPEGRGAAAAGPLPGAGLLFLGQGCLPACSSVCLAEALPGSLGLRARRLCWRPLTAQGSRPRVAPVTPQRSRVRSVSNRGTKSTRGAGPVPSISLAGSKSRLRFCGGRPGWNRRSVGSGERIPAILGFVPRTIFGASVRPSRSPGASTGKKQKPCLAKNWYYCSFVL